MSSCSGGVERTINNEEHIQLNDYQVYGLPPKVGPADVLRQQSGVCCMAA